MDETAEIKIEFKKKYILYGVLLLIIGGGFYAYNAWTKVQKFYQPMWIFLMVQQYETYCEAQPEKMDDIFVSNYTPECKAQLDSVTLDEDESQWTEMLYNKYPKEDVADYWGTKWELYPVDPFPDTTYDLVSAGPDKTFDTDDDITIFLPEIDDQGLKAYKAAIGF